MFSSLLITLVSACWTPSSWSTSSGSVMLTSGCRLIQQIIPGQRTKGSSFKVWGILTMNDLFTPAVPLL